MNPRFLLPAGAVLLLAACTHEAPAPGTPAADPIHLVVQGTDREMGLQHGRALAKEIRAEVGPRLEARFRAVAKDAKEAEFLEQACRTYTAQTKPLLPPDIADELAGVAEGSGVPEEDLLLLEVMRDGLRFHLDVPPLLEAAFASPPEEVVPGSEHGTSHLLVVAWDGPEGADLAAHALLLERRPVTGSPTLVVTWPGGLGAIAGASEHGFVAQCEVASPREALSLHGVPFGIATARALRFSEDPAEIPHEVPERNGNRVVAASLHRGTRRVAVRTRSGAGSDESFEPGAWILVPAGPGGADPRVTSMDERLGAFPERPRRQDAIALAVSGRGSRVGAALVLAPSNVIWHGALDATGKDLRPPVRIAFGPH